MSVAVGYLYFSKVHSMKTLSEKKVEPLPPKGELFAVKIYYPVDNRLQIEERMLKAGNTQIEIAHAIVEEFLKGHAGAGISNIPKDTKLLGLYRDTERILYVELSEEFRRNFQGDALTEYLLLKGLYESLISNLEDIEDIEVLIEGRYIETLGGHFYLSYPIKDTVSKYEYAE